ncbi:PLP-dependent transferase [Candidatus Vidania fulgoroideorum]
MKEITKLIHKNINKNYFNTPIVKASTLFSNKYKKNIPYGLDGNETIKNLESKIKILEKANYVSLYPSGLNAISIIYISLIKKNEVVLIPKNIYSPNLRCAKYLSKILGFKIILYNKKFNIEKFKNNSKIKLMWLEIPGSITLETPNISKIYKFLKKKKKIISIFDNTYSSSVFKPLKNKFDISIIALTKFYAGYNDITMGAICLNKKKINSKILKIRKFLGIGVSSEDSYLISRNIFNVKKRIIEQDKNSCDMFYWFIKKYKNYIKSYFFPKNNNFFIKKIKYSSGIFTIKFKKLNVEKFVNSLKLFKIGYSWGGVCSLVMMYKNINLKKGLFVRFYIGMEDLNDLKEDIKKAISLSLYN